MSDAPYISKLTGDLVVEETVRERRERDAGWMRRHKRSLGRNKQFRACVRADHELRKEMAQLNKATQSPSTSTLQKFIGALRDGLFTPRSAKA